MVGFIWLWFCVLCQAISTDGAAGMEYVLFTFRQPWNTARKVCRGHGGHLAILDTVEELARVGNLSEGVWGYESSYRWVGLQVNQSVLLWEVTCGEQDHLSNTSLALFRNGVSSGFTGGQCFVVPPRQHVMYDHPCDHAHPFICELQEAQGVSMNSQNTTEYMEEGDDSNTPHHCEPVILDGQTTTEMVQTTKVTSVPPDETSSPSNDNYSGPGETSSPSNDNYSRPGETSSPANDNYSGPNETSSPSNDNYSGPDETSSRANDNYSGPGETSSPANDNYSGPNETSSRANDNYSGPGETSSPANDNYSGPNETSSPANGSCSSPNETSSRANDSYSGPKETTSPANNNFLGSDDTNSPLNHNYISSDAPTSSENDHHADADETSSPAIVNYSGEDETTSPAKDNSASMGNIVDSADHNPWTTDNQVCQEYNIPVMSVEELRAVLALIVKELAVDKKNLSKRVRQKISAQDHRPSATGIGYVAVFIISIPLFVILVLDIPRAVLQIKCVVFTIKTKGPKRMAQLV
ncbi:uncharacterized protein [Haliotis asinina]|uniref:uncharacterized protein n=1 Tax=Haliotis asinina TaxID=109174 RepID=UPI0035321748